MKILYLFQYFNTPEVPGGTRAYEMARRLVTSGHEVTIVTSDYRGRFHTRRSTSHDVEGIRVIYIPVPYASNMGFARRLRAFFSFALRACGYAIRTRPDVVFASSTPLTIVIPALVAKWRWRVPFVFEIRDLWPHVPIEMGVLTNPVHVRLARWLERLAYANASTIVALSPGMAEGVFGLGVNPERVVVIPNASDIQLFDNGAAMGILSARYPEVPPGPVVLYAGAMGPANDLRYLVDLAAATAPLRADARFVVVGDGPERDEVIRYARERDVWEKTFFVFDRIPKLEIPDLFATSTIVTSLFADVQALQANSANKFFDGLAAGRPVAVNYGGWQGELLVQHGAGFVLSRDVHVAAQVLCLWLADPDRLADAGRAGRALASSAFSRDALAAKLEHVLASASMQ